MQKKSFLTTIPCTSGIYQFLDDKGTILYIGKANNIKKRVQQHFSKNKNIPSKNLKMLEKVKDVTWTQTDNEIEALILENTLIKEHKPKYNILLRDDKNFLYVKISHEQYPRISMVRRIINKKDSYFGPYVNATQIRSTLDFIGKIFPYECLTFFTKGVTKTPCFNYHIHRCPGLCIGKISEEEYRQMISKIASFLRGDIDDIIQQLTEKMKKESQQKAFEKAAKTRDQIRALQDITEKQKVLDPNITASQDVIGYSIVRNKVYVSIFKIREGKLKGQENYTFSFLPVFLQKEDEMLSHIVQEYYDVTTNIPQNIIIGSIGQDKKTLEEWLTEKRGKKVEISIPEKGKKHVLLELCRKNAESYADKEEVKELSKSGIDPEIGMKELQKTLGIKHKLQRIECYDISHLAGKFTVASMVVFYKGQPLKKDYRQFRIQTVGDAIDDYQSLKETLQRRLKYIINPSLSKIIKDKKESFLQSPDLIILDGGKGQLSVGTQVLSQLKLLSSIPLVVLAKENEDMFTPKSKQPVLLPKDSQAQYLIERIRDEAHRFAHSYNAKLREKNETSSKLDDIEGIGKSTKKKLMEKFKSVAGIKNASEKELEVIVGIKLAKRLKEEL